MLNVPRTMTKEGLRFLQELAAVKSNGVYVEIGPLFGSSTCFIDRGRKKSSNNDEIHTIDTFEGAPWIEQKFGFNLSFELFSKFTNHIGNLKVHQGVSPEIVKESWNKAIGFYFDDATHGNPGWMNNFNFFKPFFEEDAIICGDDFAGGWPHIVENVYSIASEFNCKLYVIGRVWAITKKDDQRISNAIDKAFSRLSDTTVRFSRSGDVLESKAASWTYGLHTNTPLHWIEFVSSNVENFKVITMKDGEIVKGSNSRSAQLEKIDSILVSGPNNMSVQYCICDPKRRTSNTKAISLGAVYSLPKDSFIVSVRLTHK